MLAAQQFLQRFLCKPFLVVIFIQKQKEGHKYDTSSERKPFTLIHHEASYNDVDVFLTMIISEYQAIYTRHVKPRAVQIGKKTPPNEENPP